MQLWILMTMNYGLTVDEAVVATSYENLPSRLTTALTWYLYALTSTDTHGREKADTWEC